mmetsp:Transcript_50796/g.99310  ORF Transcript_50796/g.99310 Transcript_50796/m.99310 type:complete len:103 (-) Transcript_50796:179-487(-)
MIRTSSEKKKRHAIRTAPGQKVQIPSHLRKSRSTPNKENRNTEFLEDSRELDRSVDVLSGVRRAVVACLEPEIIVEKHHKILDFSYMTCYNMAREGKKNGWL